MIEYERVQKIRKLCSTRLMVCAQCGTDADFITFREAASLFETDHPALNRFIEIHQCHRQLNESGELQLCVASFIACMSAKKGIAASRLLGGETYSFETKTPKRDS